MHAKTRLASVEPSSASGLARVLGYVKRSRFSAEIVFFMTRMKTFDLEQPFDFDAIAYLRFGRVARSEYVRTMEFPHVRCVSCIIAEIHAYIRVILVTFDLYADLLIDALAVPVVFHRFSPHYEVRAVKLLINPIYGGIAVYCLRSFHICRAAYLRHITGILTTR